jgi:hypothetical protein
MREVPCNGASVGKRRLTSTVWTLTHAGVVLRSDDRWVAGLGVSGLQIAAPVGLSQAALVLGCGRRDANQAGQDRRGQVGGEVDQGGVAAGSDRDAVTAEKGCQRGGADRSGGWLPGQQMPG